MNLSGLSQALKKLDGKNQNLFNVARVWLFGDQFESDAACLRRQLNTPEGQGLAMIAAELGDAAVAEYVVARYQDRFPIYSAKLVKILSALLGQSAMTPSVGIEGTPIGLFTIKELEPLRNALFNRMRDKYFPQFKIGFELARDELHRLRAMAKHPEQAAFIDSLVTYFERAHQITRPVTLRDAIGESSADTFPAPHQKIAVAELSAKGRLLLADEMGAGKTGSIVAAIEHLRAEGKIKRALIICPAQALAVWRGVLSTVQPRGYLTTCEGAPRVVIIEAGNKDWAAAQQADIVVIGLELSRGETDGISHAKHIAELAPDFLAIDEAHNAKNPNGFDVQRLYEISQLDSVKNGYIVIATGTPLPNTVRDIATQIRLLYAGREEIAGDIDAHDVNQIARALTSQNPLLMRNLLVQIMLRRDTESCLPVGAGFTRTVLESELNPIEQAIYDALLSDPFFTAIEKMTKLRKMCLESEGKYTATCNAIEVSLARSKYKAAKVIPKIVLAETSFAQGITREYEINHDDSEALAGAEPEQALAQRISEHFVGRLKVFILDGQTSHNREQILREFREHKAPALLFTLTSVAGEAIDLSCAADAILLSPALTEAQEQQFSRRLNRRGQLVWTDLQILQFSGTIEEGIAEYAARKARVVEDFINGRPLNDEERKILEGNLSAVNRGGSLAYELLSPGEKISWIISRISGKGRAAVEEFFARENGKYANDFAQHYTTNEDTSYAGNTARLVTSVIERLRVTRELAVDGTVKIADIACGCRSLERIYQEDASVRVASSDINRAALEAGGSLIGERFVTEDREVAAMDHLPYGNCVKDVAVLSLALHYSRHNPRISSKSGEERLRILGELARIVRHNGISILTFPAEKFQSEERFTEFNKAICDHFGFTLVEESSGLVQGVGAADESFAERAPYRGWVLTMTRNERVPTPFSQIPKASWVALKFDKPPADTSADDSAGGLMAESNSEHVKMDKGVYIDQFTIGHTRHNYNLLSTAEAARAEQRAADANTETQLDSVLRDLLTKYGKAEAIPEHALLSISLTKVDSATAAERDRYFRTLIEHYGSVHRVPVDKIALFSPVILIRGESRRGPYLCLASTAGRSGQMGGYGKRYLDNAFREQAGTHI